MTSIVEAEIDELSLHYRVPPAAETLSILGGQAAIA